IGPVVVEVSSEPAGVVYGADLLRFSEDGVVRVASAGPREGDSGRIAFTSRRAARYGLLLIPELLRSGVVDVSIRVED
ncbi:MAG: hypothetical protein GVY29_12405, partial [Spirochaetes bacterium]|nr:hypothetical protein [Spirochaetota bacterium]